MSGQQIRGRFAWATWQPSRSLFSRVLRQAKATPFSLLASFLSRAGVLVPLHFRSGGRWWFSRHQSPIIAAPVTSPRPSRDLASPWPMILLRGSLLIKHCGLWDKYKYPYNVLRLPLIFSGMNKNSQIGSVCKLRVGKICSCKWIESEVLNVNNLRSTFLFTVLNENKRRLAWSWQRMKLGYLKVINHWKSGAQPASLFIGGHWISERRRSWIRHALIGSLWRKEGALRT